MKFGELAPGNVLDLAGQRAVVLAIQRPHPLQPGFILIVWWLFNAKRTSFDMLDPGCEMIPGSRVMPWDGMRSYQQGLDEMR